MVVPSGFLNDLTSSALDIFNFLEQIVFHLFMLFSALLTAGLFLRPHWEAFRGHGHKGVPRKGRTAGRAHAGSRDAIP